MGSVLGGGPGFEPTPEASAGFLSRPHNLLAGQTCVGRKCQDVNCAYLGGCQLFETLRTQR